MTISAILTNGGLTVVFENGPLTIRKDAVGFSGALAAWKSGDEKKLFELMNPAVVVQSFSEGQLVINEAGEALFNGRPVQNYVLTKILGLKAQDLPWKPLAKFLERLMANTSARAVDELYKFLETENLPITDDGCFLAYKRVNEDWTDFHTGRISNKIGTLVEEDRNKVDDNPNNGCSKGLHAGSLGYVSSFHSGQGHLIVVKIDPADVVSIPVEDVRKLRCCKYFVLKEMDAKLVESPVYSGQTAQPIFTAEALESDDEDEFDDTYDEEYLSAIEELAESARQICGMPVAVDRPLNRLMSLDELDDMQKQILSMFNVNYTSKELSNYTIEELAEECA